MQILHSLTTKGQGFCQVIYREFCYLIDIAILISIELIEQHWKNTESFLIASDSLSSILAIKNHGSSNEIIYHIQERTSSLSP
ncbi:RNase H domain-containing protein [Aphis craccivora]|uniref:RNase H domain-containing protein n=1 Tax=Aphis craccivora TaxID=307492 RepID=A0A6G0Z6X1_APHCR|nr:RNase H domain-containing protein [Aphis craccivora]